MKFIKLADGKRKLILYFETWESLEALLDTKSKWGNVDVEWCRHTSQKLHNPRKKSKSQGSKTNQKQPVDSRVATGSNRTPILAARKQKSEKAGDSSKPTKLTSKAKAKKPRISKRKVLAEIRDILVKLQSIV